MTPEQIAKITLLKGRPEDFHPVFDLPEGWVAGWVEYSDHRVYYGISPEGDAHS